MKNEHGYDHDEAVKQGGQAGYTIGWYDGAHGADLPKHGSEKYREGWHHGRRWLELGKEDEGYCAGRFSDRPLKDQPEYKRNNPHFMGGWDRGVTARPERP